MAVCAVLSDCDTVEDIAEWAAVKEPWLRRFLMLPNGVPSQDTFLRIFRLIDPKQFEAAFRRWVGGIVTALGGQIAIDGKSLRGSADVAQDRSHPHTARRGRAVRRTRVALLHQLAGTQCGRARKRRPCALGHREPTALEAGCAVRRRRLHRAKRSCAAEPLAAQKDGAQPDSCRHLRHRQGQPATKAQACGVGRRHSHGHARDQTAMTSECDGPAAASEAQKRRTGGQVVFL